MAIELELTRAKNLSPSVRELTFRTVSGEPLAFSPGQWINLDVPVGAGETVRRAYSIASAPAEEPTFDLAVTRVEGGAASTALHALMPGDRVRASAPQGFFTREAADPAPAIFVGTGTGVTPFRSMLLARKQATVRAPVALLWGFRHEEDILYPELIAELEAEGAPCAITLSQPREPRRFVGYVQAHARALHERFAQPEAHVFVCGLERMVRVVRDLFRKEIGLDRRRVHSERYD